MQNAVKLTLHKWSCGEVYIIFSMCFLLVQLFDGSITVTKEDTHVILEVIFSELFAVLHVTVLCAYSGPQTVLMTCMLMLC